MGHCWVELDEQILIYVFLFSRYLFLVVCALHLVTIFDIGLLLLLLLKAIMKLVTVSFYSVRLNILM